jgi:citrate lyase subunit beta/citryl-CoA lyase
MARLMRSLLFVPANNPRFINKAKELRADIICLDLEDSVPEDEKSKARELLTKALDNKFAGEVFVRVNSPRSRFINDDLNIIDKKLTGIVIPKVDDPNDIISIASIISNLEKSKGIDEGKIELIPSIESTKGVVNAYNIAIASNRVVALVFGIFDFLNDLGVEYNEEDYTSYLYARSKVAIEARAANVYAIDSIWQKVDDINGLIKDSKLGVRLGYRGKSIIHPNQIEYVHNIFKPTNEEIEWAKKVVSALETSMREGKGAIKLEGKMIDIVHYKRAKALLDSSKS